MATARSAPDGPPPSPTAMALDDRAFAGLAVIIDALSDVRNVVLLRGGSVAFEYHRSGTTPDTLHSVESVTKSVPSTLVGIALAQGRITSLDQPVPAPLPDLVDANDDPRAQQLTVRHLLTMTAGFQGSERRFFDPKERARFAMSRMFEADPGAVFR